MQQLRCSLSSLPPSPPHPPRLSHPLSLALCLCPYLSIQVTFSLLFCLRHSVSILVSPFTWPPSLAGDLTASSRRGAPGAQLIQGGLCATRSEFAANTAQLAKKGRRGPIKYIRFTAAASAGGLGRGGWTRRAHRRCRGPGAHPPAPAAHEVQVKGHAAPPPCSTALPTCRRRQSRLRARPSLAAAATRQPASAAMGW